MAISRKMPSDLGGTRKKGSRSPISPADAKLYAAFKKAGFETSNDRAYNVPVIKKAMNVWRQEKGYGQVTKPASMTKGSLTQAAFAKRAAPKKPLTTITPSRKATAAKKPAVTKNGPRRRAI